MKHYIHIDEVQQDHKGIFFYPEATFQYKVHIEGRIIGGKYFIAQSRLHQEKGRDSFAVFVLSEDAIDIVSITRRSDYYETLGEAVGKLLELWGV